MTLHNHVGTDGETGVIARQKLGTLPTGGSWQKNGNVIEIKNPPAGTPQQYLCAQSGYGTW